MMRDVEKIKVIDNLNKRFVNGVICSPIIDSNIKHFEEEWLPLLIEAKYSGKVVQDSHWQWSRKVRSYNDLLAFKTFAVEINDRTEGLMIIERSNHYSRMYPGKHLVYVELISVAPWNRISIAQTPKYKLIGSTLLAQAIGESLEEGFEGRIGLHSLPGSVTWYEKNYMVDLGADSIKQNLHYFEMREEDTKQFISSYLA